MEYLEKLKQYVNDNLTEIPVPGFQLHKKFNVSESKLEKDFKKLEGVTPRIYLVKLKIKRAIKLKQNNPSARNIELMADINYNYGERAFRNNLKKYGKEIFEDGGISEFMMLSKNEEVFLEIFTRLILVNEFAEAEMDNGNLVIKHDVKNSIFQFAQHIIPLESTHTYFIYLDMDTMKLSYRIFIQRLINLEEEDEEIAYIPNHITPYFNMLYNVDRVFENHVNYKLTDCIKEWDKYATVNRCVGTSFSNYEYCELEVDTSNSLIKINRDAFFIKGTDEIVEGLRTRLYNEFEEVFNSNFGFILSEFKDYLGYVKEEDFEGMRYFITSFNDLDIKNIDLIIQVTCYPYLSDLDIYDYSYFIEEVSILERLSKLSENNLADILVKFRVSYSNLDEYDDETTAEELLSSLLNSL